MLLVLLPSLCLPGLPQPAGHPWLHLRLLLEAAVPLTALRGALLAAPQCLQRDRCLLRSAGCLALSLTPLVQLLSLVL